MLWLSLLSVVVLGCVTPTQTHTHTHTPTPTSTHTPMVDSSEEEVDEPCFEPCTCEVKEGVLHVHCDGRGFTNASQVSQSWLRPFKLNLQRNSLRRLYSNGFLHHSNAVAINLGNNALQDIRAGAFHGLGTLRRLYLHENKLEVFRNDTFSGLEALEYLQADYNVIKRIDSGALRYLLKLRVLILNDNLIPALPPHLFRSVSLTHLDLRGNRLKSLAYAGTLEYVGRSLMELQLEENPWICGCEAVQLQTWLGHIPYTAVVGDITCEYPFHLHGKDLREIPRKELCAGEVEGEGEKEGEREKHGGVQPPQHPPSNPKANPNSGRPRPTKPSSMVHHQNTHTSSSSTSSSAERRGRERSPRPTKRPRPSRTPPTQRSLLPNQPPPIAGYQTRPPIPIICPLGCTCNLHISDLGLTVNCKESGFNNVSQLMPRPLNGRKLYLSGNLIQRIYKSDFWNFSSLDLLHLGNNRISFIQEGAFSSLPTLRSLYLNGNNLQRLSPHMFLGLLNLRYLYFEYNEIGVVEAGVFSPMPSLQLLFLNANLLRSLPVGVFQGISLSRLNLRNNHFLSLPVEGVLEHLTGLVQVDLQQNPWECRCGAAPLKRWLEGLSAVVVVGEVVCHSPEETTGTDLRSLSLDLLCPDLHTHQATVENQGEWNSSTAPDGDFSLGYPVPGNGPLGPITKASIPLSVLVLSLLVLFVSAFFAAAALIAYALRRRDKLPFRRQGEVDLAGIQMECGIFTEQQHHRLPVPKTPPPSALQHSLVYDSILPVVPGPNPNLSPATHMCSSPVYKNEDDSVVRQQQQQFSASKEKGNVGRHRSGGGRESEGHYRLVAEREREWNMEVSPPSISTVAGAVGPPLSDLHGNGTLCPTVIDSQGPTPKVGLVDCLFGISGMSAAVPEFRDLPDMYARPPPPRYPHPPQPPQPPEPKEETRASQSLVVTTMTACAGPSSSNQSQNSEFPRELRMRLSTKPDYMEVLDRSYQF
ncbi:SLIT and NTRK-like protein 3 [Oncorhynchus mykiss]|uniref:LRRCT domain-containing protein n=2 Tax=Oncorhynchus mykiss TaxID=8022 RepID=A0A8C7NMW6_ONCMY|nr:SLIT and NTRK-like protein 3 [Oncorhynchus mykiss]